MLISDCFRQLPVLQQRLSNFPNIQATVIVLVCKVRYIMYGRFYIFTCHMQKKNMQRMKD